MDIPAGKKIVCITGTVWTGSNRAPRHLLVKDGFIRPTWFTTRIGITDADYEMITPSGYRAALSRDEVLVHTKYGPDHVGIMKDSVLKALHASELGVLVVGPQDIAAQLSNMIGSATIFALKDAHAELSKHLTASGQKGQLHRIDVDVTDVGAWTDVHASMREILNLTQR